MSSIAETLLGWIPNWVGFCFIIAAGIVMLVVGAIRKDAGFIAWGVATIASSIIAWVSGSISRPDFNPIKKSFGGTVSRIPMIPWLVIFLLFAAAVVIGLVTR